MIPIFCINLERAKKRKKIIQKEWIEKLGLDIVFWKAYDRRDIDKNIFIYNYDKQLALHKIQRELNSGEIACATSFCMLYDYIIQNQINEVIIMEDDIISLISNNTILFDSINIVNNEFPENEIVLLHNIEPRFFKKYENHNIYYERKKYFSAYNISPWGNQMMYLKLPFIKKAYSILNNIYCPADYPQKELSDSGLQVHVINNPLCNHIWDGKESRSYIQNRYRKTKRKYLK